MRCGVGESPRKMAQTPEQLPGLLVSYWMTCVRHVCFMGLVFSSVKWGAGGGAGGVVTSPLEG